MQEKIAVLGAGVLGCTVAAVLHAMGLDVTIVSAQRMSDKDASRNPRFASAYPAASIIPHSISGPNFDDLVAQSESVFESLLAVPESGVRLQRHFEIFEDPDLVSEPTKLPRSYERIQDLDANFPLRRSGVNQVGGFFFDCFFCDMPKYSDWLESLLSRLCVPFVRKRLGKSSFSELRADVLVNCLGAGASSVFPEIGDGMFLRGILVTSPFSNPDPTVVSYNYTPSPSVYSYTDGSSADVYFYPRDGHCVLGGTREAGTISPESGLFVPTTGTAGPHKMIDGIAVPRAIVELNRELVFRLTGKSLGTPLRAYIGFRHLAETPGGPGYVLQRRNSSHIVDCIGFGGAGVTLSWGAAFEVGDMIRGMLGLEDLSSCEMQARLVGTFGAS